MTKPMRKAVVELAYRLDLSETECIAELARVCRGAFDGSEPTAAFAIKVDGSQGVALRALTSEDEALDAAVRVSAGWLPVELQRRVAQSAPALVTASEVFGVDVMQRLERATGASDLATLCAPHGRGVVCIGTRQRGPRRFSNRQHREWLPVAAHLGAAWRLRNALSSEPISGLSFTADAVLVDDRHGQVSASPSLRDILRRAVAQRERMRAGNGEGLWPAVVAGEWILVDRFEDSGRRLVVAYPCGALAKPFPLLDRTESAALRRALDGTASKVIASELGVSESTVSRLLQRALRALGLRNLADAFRVRSMAHSTTRIGWGSDCVQLGVLVDEHPETERVLPDRIVGLTQAERDVLAAIVRGCSHQQVAAMRGTAKRTVANQVASIFGKLGVGSRRELVARLIGGTLRRPPEAGHR